MKMKHFSLAVISVVAATFAFTSCNLEEGGRGGNKTGRVVIDVTTDDGLVTKAGQTRVYEPVDLSTDDIPFFLSMTRTVYKSHPSVQTKGAIINDDRNLDANGMKNITERGKFDFLARNANGKSLFPSIDDVTSTNTASYQGGKWEIDHEIDFPESGSLDFWAYSYEGAKPYALLAESEPNREKKFKYTGVTPGGNQDDGSLMSDFLVANTSNQTAENNPVGIHFYHALAAVKFNVYSDFYKPVAEGGLGYQAVKVRISEVSNSGTATFDGAGHFTWTTSGAKVVYEQVLFSDNVVEPDESRTLFFIPQAAKDNLLFTFIIVNDAGKEYFLSTKSIGAEAFEAGYIYTYTIGKDVQGNVGVKVVEDNFDKEKKEHVKVELTKSAAAYVRVAIVANWFTDGASPKVYAPYDGPIQFNEDEWVYNPVDKYYYSKRPIVGYTQSDDLLSEFTCPGTAPQSPYATLHLEMNIVAQAVSYDISAPYTDKDGVQHPADPYYTAGWAWGNTEWLKGNVTKPIK